MSSPRDLDGRAFIVTGANTGIGRATAQELARRGASLTLACRSEERTRPVLDEIEKMGGKASFLQLDLGDLANVSASAKTFLDSGAALDVLINNAGIGGMRGLTRDGLELTFGTNHIGPFLFTLLLLPRLREGRAPRIVNVSSKTHFKVKEIDWDALRQPTKTLAAFPEYCVSKLCNVLFTKELSRGKAGPNVHSYAVHPGAVGSDIYRRARWPITALLKLVLLSNEEGAKTQVYCATAPEVSGDDGLYYDKCRATEPSRLARDEGLAKRLWALSEEIVRPFLSG